jgi:hypothetical protein
MKKFLLISSLAMMATAGAAKADPVDLTAYADKDGFIDVQTLTCGQLANTYQEDADHLTTWYSGWYNGLGHKHMMNVSRAKDLEHEIIVYCKAHQNEKIIHAIDVVFNEYRKAHGIVVK